MSRTVTLALVDEWGAPLGVLPPFEVDFPYWPETVQVVAAAKEVYGVDVTVLRLLTVEPGIHFGGAVTYLAEAAAIPQAFAGPVDAGQASHPLRAAYAEPGGPAASLRWAEQALAEIGRGPVTAAVQRRTWNLSTIWRLETPAESVWLKQVPAFFWHEVAVLHWLAGIDQPSVPVLLSGADGRMLLEDIPGEDLYRATPDVRAEIAAAYHPLQVRSIADVDRLVELGVPDLRTRPLITFVSDVVARNDTGDPRLRDLIEGLPDRMAAVAACGLPDTLVHGDLHPGNVRSAGTQPVIIDWGDSFVGNPAFDILRLTEDMDRPASEPLIDAWAGRWEADRPGCRPRAAVELLRPVAALRLAAVYAMFMDNIEPTEYPYHHTDVPTSLDEAAQLSAPGGPA